MITVKDAPRSGYAITAVHTVRQSVEPADLSHVPSSEQGHIQFGWDWRLVSDDSFEVLISVAVEPERERPYCASVELVGRFRRANPPASVPLENFVQLQAIAILLPYVRQFLATLTLAVESGAYHLPSINVVALMKDIDTTKATGKSQLTETTSAPADLIDAADDEAEAGELGKRGPATRQKRTNSKPKGSVN